MIDFYKEAKFPKPFGAPTALKLDTGLLENIRAGNYIQASDLSVASDLLKLVWDEYRKYGTEGISVSGAEVALAQRTLISVLDRLRIEIDIPWRDFQGFRDYWIRHEAYGSWEARRDILSDLFEPIQNELDRRERQSAQSSLAKGISPHTTLGWDAVDTKIDALRRRFAEARTSEDYSDVGNRAVSALEELADKVYNPIKHVREGEEPLPYGKTKERLDRYIEEHLSGSSNAGLRKMARATVELGQALKHGSVTTRTNAGLLGDSVILLANMLRRLDDQ